MKHLLKQLNFSYLVLFLAASFINNNILGNNSKSVFDVTYIANSGFLIEAGGKKVLIDALFDPVFKDYLAPSPEIIQAMTEAREPFIEIELVLITHPHGDHFNPQRVITFLQGHPGCRLVAHTHTISRMRDADHFEKVRTQIHEIDLQQGTSTKAVVNGINLDILCLDHAHNNGNPSSNLAFSVDMGGTRFLHMGDALIDQNIEYLNAFPFNKKHIQLLFIEYFDRSQTSQQFIANTIKPSRIVAMHIPPAGLTEGMKKIYETYPYAIVFKQSMEQRSLPIEVDYHTLTGDYLGQTPPGDTPVVFARGLVSTDDLEHSAPMFSPDGNEVFWHVNRPPGPNNKDWINFTKTMRRIGNRWTVPETSPFKHPFYSIDGKRLYFLRLGDSEGPYYVDKKDNHWGEPQRIDLIDRFPELKWIYITSVTRNGTLYFTGISEGLGTQHNHGIYRVEPVNGEYAKPELLPSCINRPPFNNWTPFIAPDESYLIFSSNRTGSLDEYGDLFISFHDGDADTWSEPISMEEPVNTSRQERLPSVSLDGRYLFFTRYNPPHNQDIFWVNAKIIEKLKANVVQEQRLETTTP